MVHQIGTFLAVDPYQVDDGFELGDEGKLAARQEEGDQAEAFAADCVRVVAGAGDDGDVASGVAHCPRQAETMGDEVPVLGHQIENAELFVVVGHVSVF